MDIQIKNKKQTLRLHCGGGGEQIFAERQAQYIQVLSAIAEGTGEGHKHWKVRVSWGD